MPEGLNSILPDIAQVCKVDRVAQQLHSSFLSSPPPSPPLTKRKESTFVLSNKLRKWNAPISSSTRRPHMVERQLAGLEWRGFGKWDPGTDAAKLRWGAVCNGVRTGCLWTQCERLLRISCLELTGGAFTVKTFTQHKTQVKVLLLMDNMTAVTYINKMGGTRSPILPSLEFELWTWCLQHRSTLRHIQGSQNLLADWESRTVVDYSDWKLKPDIFQHIPRLWDALEIDLVTSRLSHQIPRYTSWRPDPGAETVDAFALVSTDRICFLPFCISREVSKTSHSAKSSEIGNCRTSLKNTTLVPNVSSTLCRWFPEKTSNVRRSVDQTGGKPPLSSPSISRVICLNRLYS